MVALANTEAASPDLARLCEDAAEALKLSQPDMVARIEGGIVVAEGEFVVRVDGCPEERFTVRVEIESDFPDSEPAVFETEGRIPRTPDRHMYDERGACCTGVYEEWLAEVEGPSLAAFIDGPVRRFFYSQVFYELTKEVEGTGEWPFGERSHGLMGILEGYAIALDIEHDPKDLGKLVSHLRLLGRKSVQGHVRCLCGSGRRLRDCHAELVRKQRERIPPRLARRMLTRIAEELRRIGGAG